MPRSADALSRACRGLLYGMVAARRPSGTFSGRSRRVGPVAISQHSRTLRACEEGRACPASLWPENPAMRPRNEEVSTMTKIRKFLSFGALAAVLALAGCQMGGPLQRPNASLQSQGVEGQWVGTDGVAVSTLQNGVFESHSADTGELLTRGTYRHTDSRTIELSF